jgi:hypothetical protein
VKRHSVFLRKGCVLPDRLDPVRVPFGSRWMLVEEIAAPVFDTMIRHAGWHSIWMPGSRSRRGFGPTPENATHRAISRALNAVPRQFNAAELDSVQVLKYQGFFVVNVTLHPREVQQYTPLEFALEGHPQTVHAR